MINICTSYILVYKRDNAESEISMHLYLILRCQKSSVKQHRWDRRKSDGHSMSSLAFQEIDLNTMSRQTSNSFHKVWLKYPI